MLSPLPPEILDSPLTSLPGHHLASSTMKAGSSNHGRQITTCIQNVLSQLTHQIMFLVCGVVTNFVRIFVIIFLPNNPMSSRLSTKEKILAIERLRSNKTGIENKRFKPAQVIGTFQDPHVWLIVVLMIAASEINGALSNYQASIIEACVYRY